MAWYDYLNPVQLYAAVMGKLRELYDASVNLDNYARAWVYKRADANRLKTLARQKYGTELPAALASQLALLDQQLQSELDGIERANLLRLILFDALETATAGLVKIETSADVRGLQNQLAGEHASGLGSPAVAVIAYIVAIAGALVALGGFLLAVEAVISSARGTDGALKTAAASLGTSVRSTADIIGGATGLLKWVVFAALAVIAVDLFATGGAITKGLGRILTPKETEGGRAE